MRKFCILIVLALLLTLPVSAFSGITSAQNQTTAAPDGSCQVTMTVQLQLDHLPAALVYPVPAGARDITVNGESVSATRAGSVRNIDLSRFIATPGSYTLVIGYTLSDAVTADKKGALSLNLELLSGFDYPVESLDFTISFPDTVTTRPSFTSTYYPDSIALMISLSIHGNQIVGTIRNRLQDHEKLALILPVSEEMFPQPVAKRWSMDTLDLIMLCIAVLAALYWLLFLRGLPPKKVRRTHPADGITAGEIGCRLTGQGADLTMMVVSWAQMGYILIHPDDEGRVFLYKRMEMGNERGDFEQKTFRKLFGKRHSVDGTSYHYAQLCRKIRRYCPGIRDQFLPGNGNSLVFRCLMALIGTFGGISLATAFAADTGWRVVLGILLAPLGTLAAWLMQSAARSANSRHRQHFWISLAAAAAWLLLSWPAGEWNVALCIIAGEILAGFAALYGGRRSPTGRHNMAEILGLRYYLKTISPEDLDRNLRIDPQYYYDLAPYALALGVDREFARQLKNARLPQCPYLTTGMDGDLTASEWNQLLRDTVDMLDAMQKRLPLDRFFGK